MDKFHKLIIIFSIIRIFELTLAETLHYKKKGDNVEEKGREFTTYQLDVPGSRPITILEADRDKDILSPYSDFSNVNIGDPNQIFTKRVSSGPTYHSDTETYSMKPFSFSVLPDETTSKKPSLLEKFLQNYENGGQMMKPDTDQSEVADMEGAINLEALDNMERKNYRPNKNSGWVSLDPVPTYSAGKVYRWHSNAQKYKPYKPSYSQNHWNDDDDDHYSNNRPSRPSYSYDDHYPDNFDDDEGYQVPPKPFGSTYPGSNHRPYEKPYSNRPSGFHGNKPFYGDDEPDRYHGHKKRPFNDIITDNRPSNFPHYDTHRYGNSHGSYMGEMNDKPETYPDHGDGKWVLVSTTKGHQYNKRNNNNDKRSGSKRVAKNVKNVSGETPMGSSSISTVLHVLPNPRSRNITTSNGEVIEVAETGRGHGGHNPFAEPTTRRPSSVFAVQSTKRQQNTNNNNKRLKIIGTVQKPPENTAPAVLAAVGAGLLPASLAIVAPMVLGRRRRDTNNNNNSNNTTENIPYVPTLTKI